MEPTHLLMATTDTTIDCIDCTAKWSTAPMPETAKLVDSARDGAELTTISGLLHKVTPSEGVTFTEAVETVAEFINVGRSVIER